MAGRIGKKSPEEILKEEELTERLQEESRKELEEDYQVPEARIHDTSDLPHSQAKGNKQMAGMIDPSDWDVPNAPEMTVVPDGTEANLRIIAVRKGVDKNGNQYLMPTFEIIDEPLTKDFTGFLYILDRESMTEKQYARGRENWKLFTQCFDIDVTRAFDPMEEWPGQEGWAILGVVNTDAYGEQNTVKKYLRK